MFGRAGDQSANSSSIRNSRLPPSWMSVPRPAMLVAIVTAPMRARLRDDMRFLLVEAGVEHRVLDAFLLQIFRQHLRLLDRDRADQHRLAQLLLLLELLGDGRELLDHGLVEVRRPHRSAGPDVGRIATTFIL